MLRQKVAFIDSNINIEYINKIMSRDHVIGNILTVADSKVVSSSDSSINILTHATLCTKIFLDNVSSSCEFFFINILNNDTLKSNTNAFLIALSWCLDNKIKLINLSIGTISLKDVPQLFVIVNKLVTNGAIIVSACSNDNKMTFPAAFDNVISVKAIESKKVKAGFIYNEKRIDRIDISCYMSNEVVHYNDKYYSIYCSNSYATPIVSAKVCDFLSAGYNSLEQINDRLKVQSLPVNSKSSLKKIYKKYFTRKINVPVIGIINDKKNNELDDFMDLISGKLMGKFKDNGYNGICLSEFYKTDLSKGVINILDFKKYSPSEKLRFYNHYCDISYIIVQVEKKFICRYLNLKDIDLIIYDSKFDIFKHKKGTQYMEFPEYKDFDTFFTKIYDDLSTD